MEITWYGLSCFRLTERDVATVDTAPYDSREVGHRPLKLDADIVTISHKSPDRNFVEAVRGNPYVVTGPGEYEIGSVFITGVQTSSSNESGDGRVSEHATAWNTLYSFDFGTLTVAHLGDLDHVPTQAEIESLGTVNIALVPIGGGRLLNAARAAEVISVLEPSIVIPMQYAMPEFTVPLEPLSKFLKEMGISEIETQPSLKITAASLPEETKVVVLDIKQH